MPKLRCSVRTCLHHSNNFCGMGAITVSGKTASASNETCCNTFCDNEGNMTNAAIDIDPNTDTGIACNVQQCVYNQNDICMAGGIQVNGQYASHHGETECSSFSYQ
ncbi:DUF1540 domain-containing protein [Cellulosilyticum sp. I15G10I2]|uniref:DUF1540 domain-containing protein n=1 Tax=Cellulosilyticum sp. I15G10I2 TaxID=1892843 RepID=UPI00085C03F1|nr:DUF1540 domain-containing protein [Cellulosilyticum sp. I15G10I2]